MTDDFKSEIVWATMFQVEIPREGIVNFPITEFTEAEVMALTEVDEVNTVEGYFAEVELEEGDTPVWLGPFDNEDELEAHVSDLLGL